MFCITPGNYCLKSRIYKQQVEYLLKWEGYPDEDNSWVPEERLNCSNLIQAFEDGRKKEEPESLVCLPSKKLSERNVFKKPDKIKVQGIKRKLRPERILSKNFLIEIDFIKILVFSFKRYINR